MNEFTFHRSALQAIEPLLEQYLKSLTGPVEDYWEDHILSGDLYEIRDGSTPAGCFAIFEGRRLTMFYVTPAYLHEAQEIFKRVLREFHVKKAFVATSDPLFLALCLDFHRKIKGQGYFFAGEQTRSVREPEYTRECVSEIAPEEIDEVNRKTDGFFSFASRETVISGRFNIFRLSENGMDFGYGVSVPLRLIPGYHAIGMVTLPEHRRKGVGRSVLIHMADMARENGCVPISGCAYGNRLSKRTIESSGRCSTVRLLDVTFRRIR